MSPRTRYVGLQGADLPHAAAVAVCVSGPSASGLNWHLFKHNNGGGGAVPFDPSSLSSFGQSFQLVTPQGLKFTVRLGELYFWNWFMAEQVWMMRNYLVFAKAGSAHSKISTYLPPASSFWAGRGATIQGVLAYLTSESMISNANRISGADSNVFHSHTEILFRIKLHNINKKSL